MRGGGEIFFVWRGMLEIRRLRGGPFAFVVSQGVRTMNESSREGHVLYVLTSSSLVFSSHHSFSGSVE